MQRGGTISHWPRTARRVSKAPHIFILAGESSGDRLGAALMHRLREESNGGIRISGVGGEAMMAEGLEPVFPMQDIAVMGLVEIVPHLRRIHARMNQATDAILETRPDALVTIDAQVFSGLLAKRIKRAAPETTLIHYVAPTVWAWKPWRARKLAGYLDRVLALFPFEPPYFEEKGLHCDFVGHPVVERVAGLPSDAGAKLRSELGIAPNAKLLLVAPGSRRSEVLRLGERFRDAARLLTETYPELEIILPVAGAVVEEVRAMAAAWPTKTHTLDPRGLPFEEAERRKFAAFAAADFALAASGTVTLELAAFRVPMVVGYRMPKFNEFILRRIMTVDTGTLVNIITGEKIVPEYWQDDCSGEKLAEGIRRLIENEEARDQQIAGFDLAFEALGESDTPPSKRAAQSVLSALAEKTQRLSTGT